MEIKSTRKYLKARIKDLNNKIEYLQAKKENMQILLSVYEDLKEQQEIKTQIKKINAVINNGGKNE